MPGAGAELRGEPRRFIAVDWCAAEVGDDTVGHGHFEPVGEQLEGQRETVGHPELHRGAVNAVQEHGARSSSMRASAIHCTCGTGAERTPRTR